MKKATYTAKWQKTGAVIYQNEPWGNLYGALPISSRPIPNKEREKLSEEEWWDGAEFITGSGRKIIVKKD